jgi:uncharacterized protein (DUF305 family)
VTVDVTDTVRRPLPTPLPPAQRPAPDGLRRVLLVIIAVAVLVLAGGAGWLLRGNGSSSGSTPGTNSVDAGFARDMSTHHAQAVVMAGYERDNTTNVALKNLATDIETEQQFQIGEMQGWLDTWHLSRYQPNEMAWMGPGMGLGPNARMPGMASVAQMHTLESSHGTAMDKLFLQLMIRHHQGGLAMAQYAEQNATEPYVRQTADAMITNQSNEIIQMETMLRQLGGTPLPSPVVR